MKILIKAPEAAKIGSKLPTGGLEEVNDMFRDIYEANIKLFNGSRQFAYATALFDLFNAGRISGIREERQRRNTRQTVAGLATQPAAREKTAAVLQLVHAAPNTLNKVFAYGKRQ